MNYQEYYKSPLAPELTQLDKDIKNYDFVNYRDLIIGTLYSYRLNDVKCKFKVDKVLNIFVKRMKEQISALPKNCELRKVMSNKVAGYKTFALSSKCDKTKALRTLERLAELGLFEFFNNGNWISTTPTKKLSDEARRLISTVENLYIMDSNNLRTMICDCTEEIIENKKDCLIISKPKEDPKVEAILNNFQEFYEGLKVADKYLKPKKKQDKSKEFKAYTDPTEEIYTHTEDLEKGTPEDTQEEN